MATASRYGGSFLRLTSPASRTSARTFSTTLPIRAPPRTKHDSQNPEPVRKNPLIGNYIPAPPPRPQRTQGTAPSSSTEFPQATSTPSPSRAPDSSAEVAPNSDFPPPPPPPRGTDAPIPDARADAAQPQQHNYSATNASSPLNIDLASILSSKYADYTGKLSTNSDPTAQPNVRPATVTGRVQFIRDPNLSMRSNQGAAPSLQVAVNRLERSMHTEHVKSKWYYQKFHERPGLKRKRQRSERWRKRFKEGFAATTTRVRYLKKQGW